MAYRRTVALFSVGFLGVVVGAVGCGDSSSDEGGTTTGTTGGTGNVGGEGGAGGVTTTTSSTTTGPGGTGGTPFVACDGPGQAYSSITGPDCDLYAQDCPPGNTCRPTSDGNGGLTTSCSPSSGLKGLGEACAGDSVCQAGLFCVFGKCTPVCCNGHPDAPPCQGGACNLQQTFDDGPDFMWLCTYAQQCVPLTEDACDDPNEDCHLESPGVASCFPPAGTPQPEGAACANLNDCDDMLQCQSNVCRYLCTTPSSAEPVGLGGCPVDQMCTNFNSGIPNLGICQPN